jgi:preprotein translocase subunit SecF
MFESLKRYIDDLSFDFVRWRLLAGFASLLLVLASWAAFFVVGPNWGIDFTGGTEIHLRFVEETKIDDVRSAVAEMGLGEDAVQAVNGEASGEFVIRIQDATFGIEELETEVRAALAELYGPTFATNIQSSAEVSARFVVDYSGDPKNYQDVARDLRERFEGASVQPGDEERRLVIQVPGLSERIKARIGDALGDRQFEVLSTDSVGPKVGDDLRQQGMISMFATLGLVLVYVSFRFDIAFAPGAILALFHDVTITIGMFVLFQLEFSLSTIGALLTIVGYSLNDTIVIYDRIRENRDRHRRGDLKELINRSISETLTRTFATSATTMMAITFFLFMGGAVIQTFALAMFCGIIFGTYSTIFIASPMILVMEDLKPLMQRFVVSAQTGAPPVANEATTGPEGPPAT